MPSDLRVFTPATAARYLNTSEENVSKLIACGVLPSHNLGNEKFPRHFISQSALDLYLEEKMNLKLIKLNEHIDYEAAIIDALNTGWQDCPDAVVLAVMPEHMKDVEESLNDLRKYAFQIRSGLVVKSFQKEDSSFTVKLGVPA